MKPSSVLYSFVGSVTTERGARLTAVARIRANDGFPPEAFEAAADATADLIGHRPDPKTGVKLTRLEGENVFLGIAAAIEAACAVWGVSEKALYSKNRTVSVCKARFAIYRYLACQCGYGVTEAGRLLGKDHGAVSNGLRQADAWIETDKTYLAQVQEFHRRLGDA